MSEPNCEDCTAPAVTNDGRFCKACLQIRLKAADPLYRESLARRGNKFASRARSGVRDNRDPKLLGGAPREMTEDEQ